MSNTNLENIVNFILRTQSLSSVHNQCKIADGFKLTSSNGYNVESWILTQSLESVNSDSDILFQIFAILHLKIFCCPHFLLRKVKRTTVQWTKFTFHAMLTPKSHSSAPFLFSWCVDNHFAGPFPFPVPVVVGVHPCGGSKRERTAHSGGVAENRQWPGGLCRGHSSPKHGPWCQKQGAHR